MELKLIRKTFTEISTIGELYIDGKFFCYTLEDKDRGLEKGGKKVFAKTAIPRGKYTVILSYSNRFKQFMPQITNVPFFEGIRIHSGNKSEHTEGCVLVGKTKAVDFIGESKTTYASLFSVLNKVAKKEKITIEII
jgi:hypothetical protein